MVTCTVCDASSLVTGHRLIHGAQSLLICWIATRQLDITDLHVYMDDFFGWDFSDALIPFRGLSLPRRQVQLLLWDAISCLYDSEKQLSGEQLKVIGLHIDVNAGTISLDRSSVDGIVDQLDYFLGYPTRRPQLYLWLRIAGSVNWLLNVLPWGKPALSEVYRKISGKTHYSSGVFINSEV
jgi:hypothetical protein